MAGCEDDVSWFRVPWLSDMAFEPFPWGTRASPFQANFLCKGGSELHKVLRGSERPLCKKANWHIFSPSHGGMFFVRVAVDFWLQGRYSGLAALLQARGLDCNNKWRHEGKKLRLCVLSRIAVALKKPLRRPWFFSSFAQDGFELVAEGGVEFQFHLLLSNNGFVRMPKRALLM